MKVSVLNLITKSISNTEKIKTLEYQIGSCKIPILCDRLDNNPDYEISIDVDQKHFFLSFRLIWN